MAPATNRQILRSPSRKRFLNTEPSKRCACVPEPPLALFASDQVNNSLPLDSTILLGGRAVVDSQDLVIRGEDRHMRSQYGRLLTIRASRRQFQTAISAYETECCPIRRSAQVA